METSLLSASTTFYLGLHDFRPINDLKEVAEGRRHVYGHIAAHSWGDLRNLNRTCQTDSTWGRWDVGGASCLLSGPRRESKTIPVPDTLQMGNAMCGRDIPYDSYLKFIFLITGISFPSKLWNCAVSLSWQPSPAVFSITLPKCFTDTWTQILDGKKPTLSRKYNSSVSDDTFEKLPPLIDWLSGSDALRTP